MDEIKVGGLLVLYWGEFVRVIAINGADIHVENYETGEEEDHRLDEVTAVMTKK